jgi:hypothetical protein
MTRRDEITRLRGTQALQRREKEEEHDDNTRQKSNAHVEPLDA